VGRSEVSDAETCEVVNNVSRDDFVVARNFWRSFYKKTLAKTAKVRYTIYSIVYLMEAKMSTQKYKYQPEDFRDMQLLGEDIENYYNALSEYKANESLQNRFAFLDKWETLFFSIKHREVEGLISPSFAEEMRVYMEDLTCD